MLSNRASSSSVSAAKVQPITARNPLVGKSVLILRGPKKGHVGEIRSGNKEKSNVIFWGGAMEQVQIDNAFAIFMYVRQHFH
jgi:transcription elongation factor